jgi:hypothetical protein
MAIRREKRLRMAVNLRDRATSLRKRVTIILTHTCAVPSAQRPIKEIQDLYLGVVVISHYGEIRRTDPIELKELEGDSILGNFERF